MEIEGVSDGEAVIDAVCGSEVLKLEEGEREPLGEGDKEVCPPTVTVANSKRRRNRARVGVMTEKGEGMRRCNSSILDAERSTQKILPRSERRSLR